MATLTTQNIVSVGDLDPLVTQGSGEAIQGGDSLLVWDASAQKHKRIEWSEVTSKLSEYETDAVEAKNDAVIAQGAAEAAQSAAETAQGKSEDAEDGAEASAYKAEGYAVGTKDGDPVSSGSPYYENNASYYAGQARTSASNANTDALKAEGYAVGKQNGIEQQSGTYFQNNAKYFADQASTSATNAASSETNAEVSETNAGASETNAAASESAAAASALVSEGWAKGTQNGAAVQSGTYYQDNAKYYKDEAAQSASDAAASETNAAASETNAATSETNAGTSETNALAYKNAAEAAANQARSYAAIILTASGTIDQQKTVSLPSGGLVEGQIIRVLFPVGHNASGAAVYMTLNSTLVVSNQNGSFLPVPIHAMTENSSTVYKVIGANVCLEMYYTVDYDGNQTPAFVIVGNPLVLSTSDYKIYADGKIGDGDIGDVKSGLYSTAPYGWLLCNGTAYNKADYPKLWDILPSRVKNTSNNTFTIDLRETSLKGTGLTSNASNHVDPDGLGLGLGLGQFINDRNKSHRHTIDHGHGISDPGHYHIIGASTATAVGANFFSPAYGGAGAVSTTSTTGISVVDLSGGHSGYDGDTTTEVKSVGVNFIIKAM